MSAVQKNPDLERLEITLVQLGFALEQQEIQVESERIRQRDMKQSLLARIDALEVRLRELLDMRADRAEAMAPPEGQEDK
ncbi:hypothetical protein NQF87_06490 [Bombella sp. TMW 2.2559]|uniref:Accessory factor UbiK family protein n=1 Tax=Bombella dulcis TaxID=2967339 RepID=A0ABT3WIE2_9PROT|nr:hypothetical protein [Bombella dulcis]MCX5616616.1 hypothetical protein [Bombella dulcis]